MYALVESGSVTKIFNNPKGFNLMIINIHKIYFINGLKMKKKQ